MIPTIHTLCDAIERLGFTCAVHSDIGDYTGTEWVGIIDPDRDDEIASPEHCDTEYPHARAYLSGTLEFMAEGGVAQWPGELHTPDDREHTREMAEWVKAWMEAERKGTDADAYEHRLAALTDAYCALIRESLTEEQMDDVAAQSRKGPRGSNPPGDYLDTNMCVVDAFKDAGMHAFDAESEADIALGRAAQDRAQDRTYAGHADPHRELVEAARALAQDTVGDDWDHEGNAPHVVAPDRALVARLVRALGAYPA